MLYRRLKKKKKKKMTKKQDICSCERNAGQTKCEDINTHIRDDIKLGTHSMIIGLSLVFPRVN